jgi:glycosyltransferase involved in cell wall biosynthesis
MTGALAHSPARTADRGRLMLVSMSLSRAGGAEAQVGDLAIGLARRGWDVEAVTLTEGPIPEDVTAAGVRATCLHMRRGAAGCAGFGRFIRLVRRRRPDIVHSHMTHPNLLARTARPFCPMPVLVCTLHGYKMYSVRSGSYLWREVAHMATDRLADMTTVVCDAGARRYERNRVISPERLLTVPNGIDVRRYQPDPRVRLDMRRALQLRDEFVWLAAGRLEPVKDYATMLQSFSRSLSLPVRQVLLIAGGGSQLEAMRDLAVRLGIAGCVRFLGVRRDVPRLMQAADAFVLSSIYEGLPLVLLEAGASGLPAVATRVGGSDEALPEGAAALFSPPRSPEELGGAMRRLAGLADPERAAMGAAARAFVHSRFRMETVLNTWESLYRRLAALEPAGEKVGA